MHVFSKYLPKIPIDSNCMPPKSKMAHIIVAKPLTFEFSLAISLIFFRVLSLNPSLRYMIPWS